MSGSTGAAPTAARRLWAGREVARYWRSMVAVGMIAGLAGGLALAALAGARRSDRAYARWRSATAAPDAILFGTQVGAENADYSRVLHLPEVIDGGAFDLAGVFISHIDGVGKIPIGQLGSLVPNDTHLYRTLSRPLLRSGRLPDPKRDDEIVVNNLAAHKWHLHVGQHVDVVGAANLDAFYGEPAKVAVTVRSTIVGIGDSMMDAIFTTDQPSFTPAGGFMLAHGRAIAHAPNLLVRLKAGTNVDAFHRRAVRVLSDPQVPRSMLLTAPVRDLGEDAKRVTHATDVETTGLLLFAAAVAIAAVVLIGQALARLVYAMGQSVPVLRSLGFTRRDSMRALVTSMLTTVAVAAVTGVVFAIVCSRFFPVGLARRFDPGVGVHADWLVLAPGTVLVAALVALGAWLAALRATSPRLSETRADRAPRARAVLAGAPLPIALGAGLALERGRGDRALPVRPAMTGVIAAVIGIVAALGLLHGIDDALARPSRSGQVFDAIITPESPAEFHALPQRLAKVREVAAIAYVRHGSADVAGAGLPLWDIEPRRGPMGYTLLSGHAPGDGEAAAGPATERQLHIHVGDRVHIDGARPITLRITGTALLPESPHSSFDQGLWVSKDTMIRLFGAPDKTAGQGDDSFVVTARPGVSLTTLLTALTKKGGSEVGPAALPQDVIYLREVRSLPIALAIFLVLLALAALGHALVTAVQRRRRDLAVLRALGLRPRQSAACIAWLATTVGLVGIALGIPLGIVAGRLSWHWIAERTPLLYVAPLATIAVIVIAPGTLVVANFLAALPARRAARLHTAEVLRTE